MPKNMEPFPKASDVSTASKYHPISLLSKLLVKYFHTLSNIYSPYTFSVGGKINSDSPHKVYWWAMEEGKEIRSALWLQEGVWYCSPSTTNSKACRSWARPLHHLLAPRLPQWKKLSSNCWRQDIRLPAGSIWSIHSRSAPIPHLH